MGIVGGVSRILVGILIASDAWDCGTAAEKFQRLVSQPPVIPVARWPSKRQVNPARLESRVHRARNRG